MGISRLRDWCPFLGVQIQLENIITHRNEALYALFTQADRDVWHHISHRMGDESLWRLGQTVMAGRSDTTIMIDAVESTMYKRWAQAQAEHDDMLDQERWDQADFLHMSYGSSE